MQRIVAWSSWGNMLSKIGACGAQGQRKDFLLDGMIRFQGSIVQGMPSRGFSAPESLPQRPKQGDKSCGVCQVSMSRNHWAM